MAISHNRLITVLLGKPKPARFPRSSALKATAILVLAVAFGAAAGMAGARSASSGTDLHVAAHARRSRARRPVHKCQRHKYSTAGSHGSRKSRHHRRSRCLRKVLKPKPKPKAASTAKSTTVPTPAEQNPGPPPTPPGNDGCDLFAASSGSNSDAGSQAAPFRSLNKLASSLKAGQTGCLQSGETFDSTGNLYLSPGETHGEVGRPITITSTNPGEPATITHSLALEPGVNYLTFTHVDFNWSVPKPWVCWNAEGNIVPGKIISGPGTCTAGTPHAENAVQIAIGGKDDSLTYDEITNDDTNICIIGGNRAEGAVIEHDRIHNCGPTVETTQSGFPVLNEETGWHSHGVYDYGHGTIIKNNYIYDNSRDGVLLYGGGEGAIVEHNVLDHNGAGIWFGDNKNDRAAWNIITNSTSPRGAIDYGIGSYESGSGNVATDNCLDGNLSGEIEGRGFTSSNNKTDTNPLYVNTEQHQYTLQADSPCLGYGPDSAQP